MVAFILVCLVLLLGLFMGMGDKKEEKFGTGVR